MAFITKTFTTTCPGDLIGAINAEPAIGVTCFQIIDPKNGESIFEFETSLTAIQDDALDELLLTWTCPIVPPPDSGSEVVNDTLPPSTDTIWTSDKTNQEIQTATTASNNYIPIIDSSLIAVGKKFLITEVGDYILPDTTLLIAGDTITFAKITSITPTISTYDPAQLIITNIGGTDELTYDLTQDIVLVVAGTSWELQFGGSA